MDVTRHNFYQHLPFMLQLAAKARFVSIDLEMSGIRLNSTDPSPGKQTAQDAYDKARRAAQTFVPLQVGITFCHLDEHSGYFKLTTFNISVSPGFPRTTSKISDTLARRLDRCVGFSIGTLDFLAENGFKIQKSLDDGVPYLSRCEDKTALRILETERPERTPYSISGQNRKYQTFHQTTLSYIERMLSWYRAHYPGNPAGGQAIRPIFISAPFGESLDPIQLKIIHDIVQDKLPDSVCLTHYGIVRTPAAVQVVINSMPPPEAVSPAVDDVSALRGLRYLFEALSGNIGSLSDVEIGWSRRPEGEFTKTFSKATCPKALKGSPRVLVGHNVLCDLAFIYEKFFAPLPEDLGSFVQEIRKLFPCIVDTKYLAFRANPAAQYDSLSALYAKWSAIPRPVISSAARNYSYNEPKLHEAGHDSQITATVFCRLGSYLVDTQMDRHAVDKTVYAQLGPNNTSQKTSLLDEAPDEDGRLLAGYVPLAPTSSSTGVASEREGRKPEASRSTSERASKQPPGSSLSMPEGPKTSPDLLVGKICVIYGNKIPLGRGLVIDVN